MANLCISRRPGETVHLSGAVEATVTLAGIFDYRATFRVESALGTRYATLRQGGRWRVTEDVELIAKEIGAHKARIVLCAEPAVRVLRGELVARGVT